MSNRYKERASALKLSEPAIGDQEQMAMHQSHASLASSQAVESSGGSAENDLRSGECLPPDSQTPEGGVKQRERTLEELEDLLRHVRDEQRRLGLDSSLSTDQTASSEPYVETPFQRPSEVPPSATTKLAESACSSNNNMASSGPSDNLPGPMTKDEDRPSDVCPGASHIAPKAHYGAVHPAILRGFEDDDESIWLVDDEDTDSEAVMTPLSSSVEDLQDISEHGLHVDPGEEEPEHSAFMTEAIPHDQTPSHLYDSQEAALPAFQYRQVPGLLDSFEWAEDTGPKSFESPPAYEALGNTPADEVDPPAYLAEGEGSSAGEAFLERQEGLLADEARTEDAHHGSFDPWRNWGPQLRARMNSENSSRSRLGGDSTVTGDIGGESICEGSLKPEGNFEDRLDAIFGQRYHKVAEIETVEVSQSRRSSSVGSGGQECILCCETCPRSSFPRWAPTMECRHPPRVCSECLATSIRTQVHVKVWSKISCPECDSVLTIGNVEEFADPMTFRTYRRARANERDFKVNNFTCCAADCGYSQFHDQGDGQPKVRCSRCGRSSCFRCQVPWHKNLSCREYQNTDALERDARQSSLRSRGKGVGPAGEEDKQLTLGQKVWSVFEAMEASRKRKKEDNLSRKVVEETSRPCPGCSMRIEKSGGCAHMTCSQCSHEFCYECGASFNDVDFHQNSYIHRPGCSLQPQPIA